MVIKGMTYWATFTNTCLRNLPANAGKKAGEFYTPHEVSVTGCRNIIAHELKHKDTIKIYDSYFWLLVRC
ncbi:Uncharacterised protein [Ewingella americana]|uniref:DNA methylase adenine-specific domain-containing protein n=1 Tax=Ewingella americana TaxID=41202 RepID=A0A377NKG4_9GAMM|nr:Uncharacterised protein [Ewingella americana]